MTVLESIISFAIVSIFPSITAQQFILGYVLFLILKGALSQVFLIFAKRYN